MSDAIALAETLNEMLSHFTPEQRLELLEKVTKGFCTLCLAEHLPCYCAPKFDE